VHDVLCDRIEPWEHGTLVVSSRFPTFWDLNALRVERAAVGLTAEALAADADRLQAGLEHRKIEMEDEATGAAVAEGFRALGWHVERLAVMLHDGREAVASPRVREVEPVEVDALRRGWLREEGMDPDHAATEDVAGALRPGEIVMLAARDAAGEPAAYAALRIAGADAEVEDVYVTPSQRGRGLATALVATAVARARAAGVRDLWIMADDEDFAKGIYARQGFETVWVRYDAVRRPPGQPG
jgi:GNAT superfamily N-acetyltransferase